MNNPAHNDSHFNKHAEQLARSAERQQKHKEVPHYLMSDVGQEAMELLRDEGQE